MLKSRLITAFAVLCMLATAAVRGQEEDPLASVLPAEETVVFVRVDVPRAVEEMEQVLKFVDEELGGRVAYKVGELRDILVEAAANHEFQPSLLEQVPDLQAYFVVMAKDEPEEIERTGRRPTIDPGAFETMEDAQAFDWDEADWEEYTWTETARFGIALVVRTSDEETATDFLDEVKALIDRQAEQNPDEPGIGRLDVEVDGGELISDAGGNVFVGRLGPYFVVSHPNPVEVWAALMAPPDESLADTDAYRRLVEGDRRPFGLAVVNAGKLLEIAEGALAEGAEAARQAYAERVGNKPQEEWDEDDREAAQELGSAEGPHKAFGLAAEALSFAQWDRVAAGFYLDADDESVVSRAVVSCSHGEPISPILEEFLTGSGSLTPPDMGESSGACFMTKVSAARIYSEVVPLLLAEYPESAAPYAMMMGMMKMQLGANLEEGFAMLAGDSYLMLDIVRKEHKVHNVDFDEETGQSGFNSEMQVGPVPDVLVLLGLEDPVAGNELVTAVANASGAMASPQSGPGLSKRDYQGKVVFCVGIDAGNLDVYPDGLTSFAVAIAGRYLAVGSWDRVTGMMRHGGGTDPELAAIIEANPDSNLLAVVPAEFQARVQELAVGQEDQDAVLQTLLDQLDVLELPLGDEDLELRLKAALRDLVEAADEISDKANQMSRETSLVTGTHRDGVYDLESETTLTR